ncbi:MAG: bifunctional diaminohydroxyphosphoribosylaminopyrimidine deaminase/5-amino-6-(5-phosphoribosylamino)uracil reductase RibD [Brachymonas sp.]|nr:bifunctional diaminohydroxyphosphoribosylaminopyrimidine deaminase/5-amino-6-(5-phosphoribosylamino)uracil reductase RibD [Brachymonas sp.]
MHYLEQALQLAQQAIPLCRPNPRVGCIIVSRAGQIIGRGHTQAAGQPHAEVMALRDAANQGFDPAGSTVYVTLEPCSHQGRTPPCCDALIEARVARVVVSMQDPNPQVAGRGLQKLGQAGIAVEMADAALARQARDMNIGFCKRMEHGLPWVRLKTASSLDGFTALPDGRSQWITSEPARADVQQWRARACAILTGVGTVLHDNPLLNVRLPHFEHADIRQPALAIVDSHLRTPPDARLLGVARRKVWIYTVAGESSEQQARAAALTAAGAEIISTPTSPSGQVDLPFVLRDLATREINEVHVEAGATLNGALLQAGLADEWLAYMAPMLLGQGRPLAHLPALQALPDQAPWNMVAAKPLGADIRLQMRLRR